ncbi:hypothetical protein H0486_08425 [Lachnospiraceae bacterium MD1]|uniref:Glucose/Sorbosone dehydrogenase domain-containing protein n=1 Tax=Variimorphobacter saccharofermentans TaxID=2755051 RepID=A0A839JZR9_9FIRM|nr:hypothetical protein [Variimorphobacter saccharofermentans]MBB2182900.1 hypothetical protein [Variimorphobacter saccharofermentans]
MDDNYYNQYIKACNQERTVTRYLNPEDINLPPGFTIEVYAEGLNEPSSLLFTDEGEMIIATSGYIFGYPSVSRLVDGRLGLISNQFHIPLIGITYHNGDIYVAHRGTVSVIRRDGTQEDIITGLPSFGDYSNSRVAFDIDNKMYFGIGTATNSGVVGADNLWVKDYPQFHDYPGDYIILNGQNFTSNNVLIKASHESTQTGAFSPFGEMNIPYETRKGVIKASGGVMRSNPDGSELELVSWGLRSISYMKFDQLNRLFLCNNGYDIRGSRPIANAPDEFHLLHPGLWYGWPDYASGQPVTSTIFRPAAGEPPQFLLTNHPNVPPAPYASFPPDATIVGFDFDNEGLFGPPGDVYIAEFGSIRPFTYTDVIPQYTNVGHRVSRIDMFTGSVTSFAVNRSGFPSYVTGGGGFGRPSDVVFGPDEAMYILDTGLNTLEDPNRFIPYTGVIWRVTRTS